jgi:hypothetical protein
LGRTAAQHHRGYDSLSDLRLGDNGGRFSVVSRSKGSGWNPSRLESKPGLYKLDLGVCHKSFIDNRIWRL